MTTGSPSTRSRSRLTCAEAASVWTAICIVPGRMPAARIASVTPKLTSRLFRSLGRRVAYVPAPRVLVTNPSSSRDRKASRSVGLDTPSSSANSGSEGNFAPGATRPDAIRAANSSRTLNESRFFTMPPRGTQEGNFV